MRFRISMEFTIDRDGDLASVVDEMQNTPLPFVAQNLDIFAEEDWEHNEAMANDTDPTDQHGVDEDDQC